MSEFTATEFIGRLEVLQSEEELTKYQRYFKFDKNRQSKDDYFIGVRMGDVFKLAKEFTGMPLEEVEKLLESPVHEIRVGAVSILDFKARNKKTPEDQRKELFDLYIRRHDRINNWDLVDRAAPHVIGSYLIDKPREVLYELARSEDPWRRRTAIVSSLYFIRKGETTDSFKLAGILLGDPHESIHKAAGWALREAGKKDPAKLKSFLDEHAASMPRIMLRYAMEHLDKDQREYYRKKKG